jgi:hypothetical protein
MKGGELALSQCMNEHDGKGGKNEDKTLSNRSPFAFNGALFF